MQTLCGCVRCPSNKNVCSASLFRRRNHSKLNNSDVKHRRDSNQSNGNTGRIAEDPGDQKADKKEIQKFDITVPDINIHLAEHRAGKIKPNADSAIDNKADKTIPDSSKRNRSLDIHPCISYEAHSDVEDNSRTYPSIFNVRSIRSSSRFPQPLNKIQLRRGSANVPTSRPLTTEVDTRAMNLLFGSSSTQKMSQTSGEANTDIERYLDETTIVTPFAQVLACLRAVQTNLCWLMSNSQDKKNNEIHMRRKSAIKTTDDIRDLQEVFTVTEKELNWCLQQLENIQTKRPVSDMASAKFKRLLSQRLGDFNTKDKMLNQISEYISKTFMDESGYTEDPLEEKLSSYGSDRMSVVFKIGLSNSSSDLRTLNKKEDKNKNYKFTSIELPIIIADDCASSPVPKRSDTSAFHGIELQRDDELQQILEDSLDAWGLDIFEVDEISSNHALTVVAYRIFVNRRLFVNFNINPSAFLNYLLRLEASYRSTNPYHNQIHAADVLQSVHVLLQAEALQDIFSDLEVLSVLFAAAIHDVDHPGLTNHFLINTGHELALLYNDASVLENHHLAVAFTLLTENGCDFLENLPSKQRQTLRRLVIELVLATDMLKHMNLLAELRTMVETKQLACTGFLDLNDPNDRSLVLQCMIHCADLSNPTKPFRIYTCWIHRVMKEFFCQGDKEKANGLEVSAMCDRDSVVIDKAQIGFIDFVVQPLWETWCDLVHPAGEHILEMLEYNRNEIQQKCPFSELETKRDGDSGTKV